MKWRLLLRRFLLDTKLMTELASEENMRTCRTWSLLFIFVMNWDNLISYISKYSYLNISCCNIIFFSRISQLYKQSHFKAAHCSNECELTLKSVFWFTQIWRKRVKFRPWLQQIVAKLNVNMSDNNVSVQFWYLHSQLEELALSQVTSWIVACIKSNEVLNHTIIEKLINQLQHVQWLRIKKRATCTLKALKQKEKPFAKHLTTFEQTLLKAEDLKWDDAVKKTFLSNSLDVTLMSSDCHLNLCVVWWVHYLATVSQSQLKLNSEGCYSRVLYNNYIITQQSHTDNMNWELTEHIIVTATETEERQSTMSVREESDRTSYKTTMHALQRQWPLH
jgi:hypothetical protein